MVVGELELKETELLLLQNLMGGNNFGAGFDSFRTKDINAAQFKTDQRGDLYRTTLVERAQEGGRLSELEFRVDVSLDEDTERQIKVVVNREGFLRSRQFGPPDLFDRYVGNLAIVMEYRDKLEPLNSLMEEYIHQKAVSGGTREQIRMRTARAFKELVEEHFVTIDYQEEERSVCEAIIANIGIGLAKLNLADDSYPDVGKFDGNNLDYQGGRISDFFGDYLVIVEGYARPDFDMLAGHLSYILSREEEYNNLIELMEYVEGTYDI